MTTIRVLLVVAIMSISSLASAQVTMKKGDKEWTELENTLRDANLRWLCQGKYFQAKRQDCVDARAKYWDDQFFEMNPGARHANQGANGRGANRRRQDLS